MSKKYILLFIISYIEYCMAFNGTEALNGPSEKTRFERKSRTNLVSFEPLGEHLYLGLDFLLPFIKVPIVRRVDAYGNEPALININTAALISTGLLATSSALVSFIFRRYMLLSKEDKSSDKRRRFDYDSEYDTWSIFNNFKLVYTNSSGDRVETSLTQLFDTIEETFQNNGIDLSSCIRKAICARIQLSGRRLNEGDPSGVDKIVDGLMSVDWFRHFLHYTFLKDAIDSRDVPSISKRQYNDQKADFCDIKYPQCKWSVPENNLIDIISTYLKFT